MWLIETSTLTLREFIGENVPPYAILSHRWGSPEDEVSQKEFRKGLKKETTGYAKIVSFCKLARSYDIRWAWVDTCCIDKKSSAELSEAINSMFMYYQNSRICIAYLCDVQRGGDWKDSEWWARGWTLQELIAPPVVEFFDKSWTSLGRKNYLAKDITRFQKIPYSVLAGFEESITGFCVAERLSWAANRSTTRVEDAAYCLLGLFRISMPLLYGEGKRAFQRLQLEILRKYPDDTIFAWEPLLKLRHPNPRSNPSNVLAEHPEAFKDIPSRETQEHWESLFRIAIGGGFLGSGGPRSAPCTVTSWGIELRADADKLIPREASQDTELPGRERWAVTLTGFFEGRLMEFNITLVLVPSSRGSVSYQRVECQLGPWAGSYLDRNYKVQSTVKNKLFYLQYDSDMH